jgi:hypothetical protein
MRKVHLIHKHPVVVLPPHGVFLQGGYLFVSRNTDRAYFHLVRLLSFSYIADVIAQ